MWKKTGLLVLSGILVLTMSGCVALLVGGAAGAGTAVWLSDKLTQQFNVSYERTIDGAKKALQSMNLTITKESIAPNVAQLRTTYTNGKEVWIDIRKITENSTKVEVRVGTVNPDKEAADAILRRMQRYL